MAAYTSVKSGDWNDPATWGGGGYPSVAGDTATIAAGHTVTYNVSSAVELGKISIYGTFTFFKSASTKIVIKDAHLYVYSGGTLYVGESDLDFIPKQYVAEIYFNTTTDGAAGIHIASNGKFFAYGDPEYYGNDFDTQLAANWTSGKTFSVVGDFTTKWNVGDEIYVHKNSAAYASVTDTVLFTIASLVLNGENTNITINESAPSLTFLSNGIVLNLTRNIKIGKLNALTGVGVFNSNRPYINNSNSAYARRMILSNVSMVGIYQVICSRTELINRCVIRNSYQGICYSIGGLVVDLIISALSSTALSQCMNSSISGYMVSTSGSGCVYGSHLTLSLICFGCGASVYNGVADCKIGGAIYGCNTAFTGGDGNKITANIGKDLFGGDNRNNTDFNPLLTITGNLNYIRGATIHSSGLLVNNNYGAPYNGGGVFAESLNGQNNNNLTVRMCGRLVVDGTHNLASLSLKASPAAWCGFESTLYDFEIVNWTEHNVPASAQSRRVYVRGSGWSAMPTAAQLFLEAEYYNAAGTWTRTTIASTNVLTGNDTWEPLTVAFTPGRVGDVTYRVVLAKYAADATVYLDHALYFSECSFIEATFDWGESVLPAQRVTLPDAYLDTALSADASAGLAVTVEDPDGINLEV